MQGLGKARSIYSIRKGTWETKLQVDVLYGPCIDSWNTTSHYYELVSELVRLMDNDELQTCSKQIDQEKY